MPNLKGRKKCDKCGKRYNWYYSSLKTPDTDPLFKGKSENGSEARQVKVLSVNNYEVTVTCPECDELDIFRYKDK